jgi:paraquat-inducible protein B
VGIQLEKENLNSQLEQTKLKLSNLQSQISQTIQLNANLQNQFQQINSILKTTEQPGGSVKEEPLSSGASKKVEVQLYPQNKAEVKDEK